MHATHVLSALLTTRLLERSEQLHTRVGLCVWKHRQMLLFNERKKIGAISWRASPFLWLIKDNGINTHLESGKRSDWAESSLQNILSVPFWILRTSC